MSNGKIKHAFLFCRKHNRVHFGSIWTTAKNFITFLVENKISRSESRFEEVECDICRRKKKEAKGEKKA